MYTEPLQFELCCIPSHYKTTIRKTTATCLPPRGHVWIQLYLRSARAMCKEYPLQIVMSPHGVGELSETRPLPAFTSYCGTFTALAESLLAFLRLLYANFARKNS